LGAYLIEQELVPLLLGNIWYQEQIRAWFHNRTKILEKGLYGKFTKMSNKPPR